MHAALRLLGSRCRSEYELRQRLVRQGFSPVLAGVVLERLRQMDYLDDGRFARSYIRDRLAVHPEGRMRLRLELERRFGVNKAITEEALNELLPAENEKEAAYRLAERRREMWSGTGGARKLQYFLLRRGFNPSLVREVVGELEPHRQ